MFCDCFNLDFSQDVIKGDLFKVERIWVADSKCLLISGVWGATTMSEWVFAIMLKRKKSGCTIRHRYMSFA